MAADINQRDRKINELIKDGARRRRPAASPPGRRDGRKALISVFGMIGPGGATAARPNLSA